jgi:TatD DNase family protein
MPLIDTHCHLNLTDSYDDMNRVIDNAMEAGVSTFIVPGIDIPTSEKAIELADKYDSVYAAVGIHPNDVLKAPKNWLNIIDDMSRHPKVVAIGESGLDFYWDDAPPEIQKTFFLQHLDLAIERHLPIIIHNRDADDMMKDIILSHPNTSGVFHCWPSGWDLADAFLHKGYHISITGTVTFKKNVLVQDVVSRMPLDRLMLETDSPFLTPTPHRGIKPNEPKYLPFVADKVAALRDLSRPDIDDQTSANAQQLFGLKL